MELRWLNLCDKNGVWYGPILQIRTSVGVKWRDIPIVAMKTKEYEEECER